MRQTHVFLWFKPSYMFRHSTSHQRAVYKKTGRYTQPGGGLLKAQTCTRTPGFCATETQVELDGYSSSCFLL
jgi:hypothetical protein